MAVGRRHPPLPARQGQCRGPPQRNRPDDRHEQTYAQIGYLRLDRDISADDRGFARQGRNPPRRTGQVPAILVAVRRDSASTLPTAARIRLSLPTGSSRCARLAVTYEDECLELGVSWRRDYERIGDFRKGSTIILQYCVEGAGPLSLRSPARKQAHHLFRLVTRDFQRGHAARDDGAPASDIARHDRVAAAGAAFAQSRPRPIAPLRSACRRKPQGVRVAAAAGRQGDRDRQRRSDHPDRYRPAHRACWRSPTAADADGEVERLRPQVLRNLIDETLQIQARQGRGNHRQAGRHRQDRRARRRQCEADARTDGRLI